MSTRWGIAGSFSHAQSGISIVELLVAVALLLLIAAGAVTAIVGSFSSSRLAKEQVRATALATEGLEAAEAIRNADWTDLAIGTHGLDAGGGSWSFVGSSDTDTSGRFVREVEVTAVERDGSDAIVSTGGSLDPETKLVTVSVTWNFTPGRQNQVVLSQYLTNWQQSQGTAGSSSGGGSGGGGSGSISSCADYCADQSYATGTCRANTNQCTQNSETYESAGDSYCPGGGGTDTCCCAP